LEGVAPEVSGELWRLDADHGNVLKTFDAMGRPAFPSRNQISLLRAAGHLSPPERIKVDDGLLNVTIPSQGLVVIKIGGDRPTR
jgi:xylan 1,4-beta-xylosidase